MRAFSIMLCLLILAAPLFCQEQSEWDYVPYEEEEFPQWLLDVRRAEVIFIGSFPLSMLLSTLLYEAFRFGKSAVQPGPSDPAANPIFGSFTSEEKNGLIIAGVSVSGIVTILDFILGRLPASESE